MGAVKNHFHDEICAMPDPYEGDIPKECNDCGHLFAELTEGLCVFCHADHEEMERKQ